MPRYILSANRAATLLTDDQRELYQTAERYAAANHDEIAAAILACAISIRKEYFGQSNRASQTYSRNTRLITRYLTQARVIEHHTQTSEKKARLYTIKTNKLSRHLRPEVIFDGREFNSPITLARNIDTKARTSVSTQQVTT